MAGPLDFEAEELAQAAGAAPAIHGVDMDGALVQYITSASSDPTVNDDAGDGYKVGLIWIRLDNNSRWQLDDSTVGAAVWTPLPATAAVEALIAAAVAGASGKGANLFLNGSLEVWQAATSKVSSGGGASHHTADMCTYRLYGTSAGTVSRQSFSTGQTDVAGNPKYFMRSIVTASTNIHRYAFHCADIRRFENKTIAVTFNARVASGTLALTPKFVQGFGSGGSASVSTSSAEGDATATTTWQQFTRTFVMPSIAGKTIGSEDANAWFALDAPSSTYTLDIAQIKVEEGDTFTGYAPEGYTRTAQNCMPFYQKSYRKGNFAGDTNYGGVEAFLLNPSGNTVHGIRYRTEMNTVPAVTIYNPSTGGSGTGRDSGAANPAFTATNIAEGGCYAQTTTGNANAFCYFHYILDSRLDTH